MEQVLTAAASKFVLPSIAVGPSAVMGPCPPGAVEVWRGDLVVRATSADLLAAALAEMDGIDSEEAP